MNRFRAAIATLALGVATSSYAQSQTFVPPRLLKAELAALPVTTIVGGGEVLIEAIVDRTGVLGRPIIVRGTPPYTQLVFDAIRTWRFTPARTIGPDGVETTVEVPVSIGAAYRPPILTNGPTIAEAPKDWSRPSVDVSYPTVIVMPNYPADVRDGGVVLFEVSVNEAGLVTGTRSVASKGGFEGVSREALVDWRFRGGSHRARPVPSTAYVLFGFREPVGPVMLTPPQSKPPYPPEYAPKPPAKPPFDPDYTAKPPATPPFEPDYTPKPPAKPPYTPDFTPKPLPPATP